MRSWASVVVLAAVLIAPDVAGAETPAEVYSDYAADGVLSCGHSRAALKGVLNDASIYQYGDPLTLVGLKLAVRKQLEGGCRGGERAALPIGSADPGGGAPTEGSGGGAGERETSGESKSTEPKNSSTSGGSQRDAVVDVPATNVQDGRLILLGIVLLLLTLGSGGWAARRAFSD